MMRVDQPTREHLDRMVRSLAKGDLPDSFRQWPAFDQWIVWKRELRKGATKPTKPPYSTLSSNPDKPYRASTTNPKTWCSFERAYASIDRLRMDGIGFVFAKGDRMVGIDLDHVINLETGEITELAQQVLKRFAHTFIEISPSGDGFHIWCRGNWPIDAHKVPDEIKWMEVYDYKSPRYFTVTGCRYGESLEISECQDDLNWLAETFYANFKDSAESTTKSKAPHRKKKKKVATQPIDFDAPSTSTHQQSAITPVVSQSPKATPKDTASLIAHLLPEDQHAINRLDKVRRAQFDNLFEGNHGPDHSASDFEYNKLTAWCTSCNRVQMDRMFRASGLCQSIDRIEKWDRVGMTTIDKAIAAIGNGEPTSPSSPPQHQQPTIHRQNVDKKPSFQSSWSITEHYQRIALSKSPEIIHELVSNIESSDFGQLYKIKFGKIMSIAPRTITPLSIANLINSHFPSICIYNSFTGKNEKTLNIVTGEPLKENEEWKPKDIGTLQWRLEEIGYSIKKRQLQDALDILFTKNTYNPAIDKLESFQWDGVDRLSNWLTDYLHAQFVPHSDEHIQTLGKILLIAIVARVFDSGCKSDIVPIIYGAQGIGKSTFAKAISDAILKDSFLELTGDIDNNETAYKLAGKIIVEMPELSAMKKTDIEGLKAFFTKQADEARWKYDREPKKIPRTCTFIGTSNIWECLPDTTGNRRHIMVNMPQKIDLPNFKSVLPQLLAQAVHLFKNGEKWYSEDPAFCQWQQDVNSTAYQADPLEKLIRDIATKQFSDFSTQDIIEELLRFKYFTASQLNKPMHNRICDILRVSGFETYRKRVGTHQLNVWRKRPEEKNKNVLRDDAHTPENPLVVSLNSVHHGWGSDDAQLPHTPEIISKTPILPTEPPPLPNPEPEPMPSFDDIDRALQAFLTPNDTSPLDKTTEQVSLILRRKFFIVSNQITAICNHFKLNETGRRNLRDFLERLVKDKTVNKYKIGNGQTLWVSAVVPTGVPTLNRCFEILHTLEASPVPLSIEHLIEQHPMLQSHVLWSLCYGVTDGVVGIAGCNEQGLPLFAYDTEDSPDDAWPCVLI